MKSFKLFLFVLFGLFLIGCNRGVINSPNVEASQYITPRVISITDSANTIDNIVQNSEFQTPVRTQTDNIREKAEELSYEKVNALYAGYAKIIDKLNKRLAELEGEAKTKIKLLLIKLSVGLTLLSGALLFFRQRELAGLGGGLAAVFFGAAQVYGLWWVELGLGITLLGGISYVLFVMYKKTKKEETAHITFRELDKIYNEANQKEKDWMDEKIFGRLSRKMDEAHKVIIRKEDLTK